MFRLERLLLLRWMEVPMKLMLTSEETRLLLRHLTQHLAHMDAELVHTDKRELQRLLVADVNALRALTDRIGSNVEEEATSDMV